MIVAGLGFRKGVTAESLKAALSLAGRAEALATAEGKESEPGLRDLSAQIGLKIIAVPRDLLAAQGIAGSARSLALYGTGSVAEAAALAAAGPGARLLVTRTKGPDGMAVVALAKGPR
jgi:cobalt-precorrin 5A hydrolase